MQCSSWSCSCSEVNPLVMQVNIRSIQMNANQLPCKFSESKNLSFFVGWRGEVKNVALSLDYITKQHIKKIKIDMQTV